MRSESEARTAEANAPPPTYCWHWRLWDIRFILHPNVARRCSSDSVVTSFALLLLVWPVPKISQRQLRGRPRPRSLAPRLLVTPRLLVRATLCGTLRPCATLRPRLQCSAVGGPHAWRAISALPPVATLSVLPHDTPPPHPPQKATSQTINYQGRRPALATT